jgi:hypothetical protein
MMPFCEQCSSILRTRQDIGVDVDVYKHDPFHAFNFSIPGNYVQSDFPLYNYYQ